MGIFDKDIVVIDGNEWPADWVALNFCRKLNTNPKKEGTMKAEVNLDGNVVITITPDQAKEFSGLFVNAGYGNSKSIPHQMADVIVENVEFVPIPTVEAKNKAVTKETVTIPGV